MEKSAKKLLVYSLAGILLSGIGAPIVQAAPQGRGDRQQQELSQTEQEKQEAKKQEQQRVVNQRQEQQRQSQQEQQRVVNQRQEQQRQSQQEQQRMVNQRQEQQRAEQLRTTQQRVIAQRLEQQRADQQRLEQQRVSVQRQEQQRRADQLRQSQLQENDREWRNRNYNTRDYGIRRHEYNNDQYRSSQWISSSDRFEHRQPWEWRSRDISGRHRITDSRWDREFPGLRSYRWQGNGFWYQGNQYRNLVLFYDGGDTLVAVGFWNNGRFIMIRDDNRSYYNNSPFVLGFGNSIFQINIRL